MHIVNCFHTFVFCACRDTIDFYSNDTVISVSCRGPCLGASIDGWPLPPQGLDEYRPSGAHQHRDMGPSKDVMGVLCFMYQSAAL